MNADQVFGVIGATCLYFLAMVAFALACWLVRDRLG